MAAQRISFDFIEVPPLHTGLLRRAVAPFKSWRERAAQQQLLAQLDARMLQDIGLTPGDVWRETH